MINKLYVIQDRVAEESGPIFEAKNDGIANRKYSMFMEDKPFKDDYELLAIGEVDHETNQVSACEPIQIYANLGMALDLEEPESTNE